MEVLVMRSSNELHSQELFPSKKLPYLSQFFFLVWRRYQHNTQIAFWEKRFDKWTLHDTSWRN